MTPVFFTTSILRKPARLFGPGAGRGKLPLRVRVGYFQHPELGHTLIDTGYAARVVRPTGVLARGAGTVSTDPLPRRRAEGKGPIVLEHRLGGLRAASGALRGRHARSLQD